MPAAVGAAERPEPCMPAAAGALPAGAEPEAELAVEPGAEAGLGAEPVVELGAEPAVELGAVAGLLPGAASVCRIRYRI